MDRCVFKSIFFFIIKTIQFSSKNCIIGAFHLGDLKKFIIISKNQSYKFEKVNIKNGNILVFSKVVLLTLSDSWTFYWVRGVAMILNYDFKNFLNIIFEMLLRKI